MLKLLNINTNNKDRGYRSGVVKIRDIIYLLVLVGLFGCTLPQLDFLPPFSAQITEDDFCPIPDSIHSEAAHATWTATPSELIGLFDPEHPKDQLSLVRSHPMGPFEINYDDASDFNTLKENTLIWPKIRSHFQLDLNQNNSKIRAQRNWYLRHPKYLARVIHRASPYLYYISEEIKKRNMPMELALLPIVESAFDPFAYSHSRASGIWQFIPSTGKIYGLKQNWWYDGRRDVIASTQGALDFLTDLNKRFDGDWLHALAAYNSGGGTVNKAIRKNKRKGRPTDFWALSLPKETRAYVPKLIALAQIFKSPEQYGITLGPIPNRAYFDIVELDGQIDLAQATQLAGLKINELYQLNPGFNRWATDPEGPHRLVVPLSQAEQLRRGLAQLTLSQRVQWKRYKIKSGDSLSTIAVKFNTKASVLRQVNNLKGSFIRAGKTLLIPSPSHTLASYSLSAEQRQLNKQTNAVKGKQKTIYRVKKGDSLWTIARKHRVTSTQLSKWNGIAKKGSLQINQKLAIWLADDNLHNPSPNNGHRPNIVKKLNYRVRKGDSLSRIAQKFNVNVAQLTKWNQLERRRYLQPGQSLTVFVDITNAEI